MSEFGHGNVGSREENFTTLLALRNKLYDPKQLAALAQAMKGEVDSVKDGPDPEENLFVPAGYTYLGQFIDHDLTFDSTSSLLLETKVDPSDLRTPRFDLDCLYGDGPDAQPYLYDADGLKLLYKNDQPTGVGSDPAGQDLLRNPLGRAIIGDKRNDENSIISQIQLAFVKYHNAVVDKLKQQDPNDWNTVNNLFISARNEVRWAYQKIIVEDYLPRIIDAQVLEDLKGDDPDARKDNYLLYTEDKRSALPREFVGAAYRFGHSMVRTGYRLNSENRFNIFPPSGDPGQTANTDSLLGFDPLPANQVIDHWSRFFPDSLPLSIDDELRNEAADDTPHGIPRLQYAYKIDTILVDPLAVLPREVPGEAATQQAISVLNKVGEELPDKVGKPARPSLALLNLFRGNTYKIAGGQAFAEILTNNAKFAFTPLETRHLVTRVKAPDQAGETFFKFAAVPADLLEDTPLWFYILAEAQAPLVDAITERGQLDGFPESFLLNDLNKNQGELNKHVGTTTQLRGVGGRIVAEVFYGLLDADAESYVYYKNSHPEWKPVLAGDDILFRNLLKFVDASKA